MPVGLTLADVFTYLIPGVGAALLLGTLAFVTYRRTWSKQLRLLDPPEHCYTPVDLLLGLLLFFGPQLLTWVAWASFRVLGEATTQPASAPAVESVPAPSELLVQIALYLAIGAVLVFLARTRVVGGISGWGLRVEAIHKQLLLAVASFLAIWPVCIALLATTRWVFLLVDSSYALREHDALQTLRSPMVTVSAKALTALSAIVFAPMVEELLFRGLVQSALARWWRSQWLAIAVSAGVFGFMHLSAAPDTVPALVFFGLILGYAYARTRSLTLAILIHVVFNAENVLADLLAPPVR